MERGFRGDCERGGEWTGVKRGRGRSGKKPVSVQVIYSDYSAPPDSSSTKYLLWWKPFVPLVAEESFGHRAAWRLGPQP